MHYLNQPLDLTFGFTSEETVFKRLSAQGHTATNWGKQAEPPLYEGCYHMYLTLKSDNSMPHFPRLQNAWICELSEGFDLFLM